MALTLEEQRKLPGYEVRENLNFLTSVVLVLYEMVLVLVLDCLNPSGGVRVRKTLGNWNLTF